MMLFILPFLGVGAALVAVFARQLRRTARIGPTLRGSKRPSAAAGRELSSVSFANGQSHAQDGRDLADLRRGGGFSAGHERPHRNARGRPASGLFCGRRRDPAQRGAGGRMRVADSRRGDALLPRQPQPGAMEAGRAVRSRRLAAVSADVSRGRPSRRCQNWAISNLPERPRGRIAQFGVVPVFAGGRSYERAGSLRPPGRQRPRLRAGGVPFRRVSHRGP